MFPTFISILDIQSWWEVPSIAHFCSLFRTAFNLLDFDIEDLEEALLTDGTEESSWLQELIVRLLSGCLPSNEISTFNYQMFLRRLFRQKCQEHDRYNPFNTDIDFQLLPLRTKVDILHALCDFRLDADDVLDQLRNLEADSLRVEPLGYDSNDSAYWYFYGTRLYREDFRTKNSKKKSVWQVICFTEDDWFQLTRKFKKSTCKVERQLHQTLSENFLPELPRLFKEKESLARKRLLENQPRRTSNRLRKLVSFVSREGVQSEKTKVQEEIVLREKQIKVDQEEAKKRRQKAYERRVKLKEHSEEDSLSEVSLDRHEMAGTKSKKSKERQRKNSYNSNSSKEYVSPNSSKRSRKNALTPTESPSKPSSTSKLTTVGRQTNNSLSAATGQILIQPVTNPTKKKLKTSQIFRQTDEDLQTGMHKILDFVKNHEDAWPFADPVEEEYAPNYYTVIRKPMDLQRMEERLDSGYYKTFSKFRSDFQLIVDNCRLYNGAENEYTEMVDNLEKVFERGTEKYLDQISSSDDEIAVEFLNAQPVDDQNAKVKSEEQLPYKRKPMLSAQTDKKRNRSDSEDSLSDISKFSEHVEKSKKVEKVTKKQDKEKREKEVKKDKLEKESKKDKSGKELKRNKSEGTKAKTEIKKEKETKKTKDKKSKSKKATKKEKKKAIAKSRHVSRSPSRSVRSDMSSPPPSWPPSSPDSRFDFIPKKRQSREMSDSDDSLSQVKYKRSGIFENFTAQASREFNMHLDKKIKIDYISPPQSPKPKDKHNKLRETIEKLKAKSELKLKDEFDFEVDHPKENKDKNKNLDREEKQRSKTKEKPVRSKKEPTEPDLDCNSTTDSVRSENRRSKKAVAPQYNVPLTAAAAKNASNLEALSIATEQTLKDINKWLDDTPKFSEFSSASNSPSYTGLDEFDVLAAGAKIDNLSGKKLEKQGSGVTKKDGPKDAKKRSFRDPAKFFKRREVQRTIERLQPGKSKGNLIANVQNTNKVEEVFPLGPLSKIKDTKNSLIVKTDTNAPKLSLGSVLDSFGKHKFVDDQKKEEQIQTQVLKEENQQTMLKESGNRENKNPEDVKEVVEKEERVEKETNAIEDSVGGGATPNLSAWFKAFGAPKMQAPQKKTDMKPDGKENEKTDEVANKNVECRKVALPTASPNTDSPLQYGQPTPRQRKISTGSSMSERSSFSQDMDSPRVGFDERGAYPAPYPSPLHRSPSGASPVMASPRPDISPKAYPTINGQIRVGFYQDTVSNKSSPDKSCSPRENLQSPYPHYSEHVYTPTTTESSFYSYAANSPYYSHAPNYSSTNPTPPYNTEASNASYYDTGKSLTDQYQARTGQKYAASSPLSDRSSPARRQARPSPGENAPCSPGIYSQHSPIVMPQHSPSINAVQSPSVHSQPSPNVHTPPSVQSQHSPVIHVEHSPKPSPDVTSEQDSELLSSNEESKMQQQGGLFPVKKRAYSDDLPQISIQRYEIDSRLSQRERISQSNQVIELDVSPEPSPTCPEKRHTDSLMISELKPVSTKESQGVETPIAKQQADFATAPNVTAGTFGTAFNNDSNYPLNIPPARTPSQQSTKLDMSKYTNMGYTGPEVNLTRSLSLQHYNKPELSSTRTTVSSSTSQKYMAQQSLAVTSQSGDMAMRYGNPNSALQQMGYKGMEMTNPQQAHSNFGGASRTTENVVGRLAPTQEIPSGYKPEVTIPRPSYNNPAIDVDQPLGLGRNISNHIVDRFGNDERMMAGLQPTASYYTDKGLGTSHMFNKVISTSASALPMFSQANIAAMQSFNQNVQGTTASMYNRQMSELQNPGLMHVEDKSSQPPPEKKTKKRKSKSSASVNPPESQLTNTANQGFQSYAGLKGNAPMEPGAISLKTSSVVPGSAFNFGPTPAGLGIGTGLYGDKDAFPNFLEEFRSAPNYYMAAAAAVHHRSTPEVADKQAGRAAHQSSNPQAAAGYPFLGAPQARPTYPMGGPFIPNAQAQLMDTSSPLYQQYIQAGLLNQGLLGPPGAYPPGYHAALSMRQPYDSMTRPSWL